MKIPLDLINGVRIASPCPASWEQMAGDDRVRHCSLCHQSVYDLSSMTGAEVARFLGAHDEDVCVRLYRRADGTVMTRDCPRGVRARVTALVTWVALAGLSLLGFFLFRGWEFHGQHGEDSAAGPAAACDQGVDGQGLWSGRPPAGPAARRRPGRE
jgi:hypothetical protein